MGSSKIFSDFQNARAGVTKMLVKDEKAEEKAAAELEKRKQEAVKVTPNLRLSSNVFLCLLQNLQQCLTLHWRWCQAVH